MRHSRTQTRADSFFSSSSSLRPVDRHASYKPVPAHGSSSPRRSATFSSAALVSVATSRLHAIVAGKKEKEKEIKDAQKVVEAAAPELLLGFSGISKT